MTTTASGPQRPVGELLRSWRERRRLSQLELALGAAVSTRHLSCVETGRARPSQDMVRRLTEHLQVPLRERNEVLLAAGFAPVFTEQPWGSAGLTRVVDALRRVLDRHEPYPAVVLNRWWELEDANRAVGALLTGVAPHLLEPPVNVLRLTLHPDGLAPRLHNLGQWRAHLLHQLDTRLQRTGDPLLAALHDELRGYPGGGDDQQPHHHDAVVPMVVQVGDRTLSMFTLAAAVTTAGDVTVEEVTVETFYPADDATARHLLDLHRSAPAE